MNNINDPDNIDVGQELTVGFDTYPINDGLPSRPDYDGKLTLSEAGSGWKIQQVVNIV